jgi:hypothetical protein
MSLFDNGAVGGPGHGLFPKPFDVRVKASEALTKGDVCQFDFAYTAATSKVPGNVAWAGYLVRDPDTTELQAGFFAVCLESIASGAEGMVRFKGIVNALTDGSVTQGMKLVTNTSGQLVASSTIASGSHSKILGFALETDTGNFADVLFNGEGIGSNS